ncbi:putative cytochrome-b5 reductase [Dioszegia hungarica]|uniref:cytochrome-b5 reductase n=1 Tax=Dioszegia hungarica TaxID=4972 RepID=A0AA38H9V8_9TREE|nr:putative cytochrome-b5 reductase [Dioszegia hungarica]KAI9637013.1 putative cytochrome-b5 reductase [Dioszegia hungarica]
MLSRASPLARSAFRSAQPVARRGYAGAPNAAASNTPLFLGLAGLAGLGGYVYLQRNPSIGAKAKSELHDAKDQAKSKFEDVKGDAKAKLDQVKGEAKAATATASTAAAGALVKDAWVPFKLESVENYNHNTKIYHFTFGEGNENKSRGGEIPNALLVRSPEGDGEVKDAKGKPVIRPYTPISGNDQKGGLSLMIKEYKDGLLTPYISAMKPGSELLFKGPIPKFKYEPNQIDRGLCVSGGSGVTPMYQLITHSLSLPEDKTKWTLVFSNVTEADILLRKEFDALAKKNPDRFEVKYVLDKPPKGWKGETGFVTPEMISKVFPKGDDRVKAFVCGPPPQVKSLAGPKDGPRQGELLGAFKDLGYMADEVFKF